MSFQPDFNHPDSQSWQRLIAWPGIIIFALAVIALPLASFIADTFVSGILHYLVMIALFMAILKALTPLHKYLTRICGNHTPAVICDHQGITFYNLRDVSPTNGAGQNCIKSAIPMRPSR